MSCALIIAQHDVTAAALQAVWKLARLEADVEADPIVVDGSRDPVTLYDHLTGRIQAWVEDKNPGPGEGVVLIDHVRWGELNVLGGGWSSVIAMLVLTYPELRWVFGVISPKVATDSNEVVTKEQAQVNQSWHQIAGLFSPDYDPIFDLSGIRWHIRDICRTTTEGEKEIAPYIPLRNRLSAALDDEPAYAYFHAYTAYRYGYRSVPVVRDDLARYLFREKKAVPEDLHLTIEDVFLSYPDQQKAHYSELSLGEKNSRASNLEGLTKAKWRLFVTSGQSHQSDEAKSARNKVYIKDNAGVDWAKLVFKPLGGVFDLWDESGLQRRLKWRDGSGRIRRGVAQGFVWPPLRQSHDHDDTGHSSPGRLALVATRLIERARRLLADDHLSIPDAVKGAVWVTDALELLGGRTPTTAIEALSLKHQFEVLAECGFPGVEYHLIVKPRLKEIQRELEPLSAWFHRSQRTTARLNAEMTILNRLIQIFREHGEFDEEQICMNRVRHLNNTLWLRDHPARYLVWPVLRYIEVLIGSFPLFVLVIAMWIALLSSLYWVFHGGSDYQTVLAVEDAITSFFSIGGPIHHGPDGRTALTSTMGYAGVICLAVVSGCVHLGVFISHLYSMISRK